MICNYEKVTYQLRTHQSLQFEEPSCHHNSLLPFIPEYIFEGVILECFPICLSIHEYDKIH